MLMTTTATIQGREIVEYKGLVFGEVVSGVNIFKDMFSGIRDVIGGRSGAYEGEIGDARDEALEEMMKRAQKIGANAIIGIDVDYEVLGEKNGMLMVSVSGTAVGVK